MPQVPSVPSVETPSPAAPKPPSPKPPSTSAPSAAVQEAAGGAQEAAEAVTRVPAEVVGKVAPGSNPDSSSGSGSSSSGSGGAAGASAPPPGGQGASVPDARRPAPSIDPAAAAPLGRLLAYVWPAIALDFAESGIPLLVKLGVDAGMPLVNALGLLSGFLPVGGLLDELPPGHQATPGKARPSPLEVPPLGDGMGLLLSLLTGFLVAVCLLAMARLVVGEELFEPRRWRHHL